MKIKISQSSNSFLIHSCHWKKWRRILSHQYDIRCTILRTFPDIRSYPKIILSLYCIYPCRRIGALLDTRDQLYSSCNFGYLQTWRVSLLIYSYVFPFLKESCLIIFFKRSNLSYSFTESVIHVFPSPWHYLWHDPSFRRWISVLRLRMSRYDRTDNQQRVQSYHTWNHDFQNKFSESSRILQTCNKLLCGAQ